MLVAVQRREGRVDEGAEEEEEEGVEEEDGEQPPAQQQEEARGAAAEEQEDDELCITKDCVVCFFPLHVKPIVTLECQHSFHR